MICAPSERKDTPMRWALALLLTGCALGVTEVRDPIAILVSEGTTIALSREPCAIAEIENLPYHASWREGDRSYAGCWGVQFGHVVVYWSDRTVSSIPAQAFQEPRAPGRHRTQI
jgi:hypothetical protein